MGEKEKERGREREVWCVLFHFAVSAAFWWEYTSLQKLYTHKEAHLTPTDISEDWIEHTFQNISSAMWAIHKVRVLKCMPRQAFLRDCSNVCIYACVIYVSILCGDKGRICCVWRGNQVLFSPLPHSFLWMTSCKFPLVMEGRVQTHADTVTFTEKEKKKHTTIYHIWWKFKQTEKAKEKENDTKITFKFFSKKKKCLIVTLKNFLHLIWLNEFTFLSCHGSNINY